MAKPAKIKKLETGKLIDVQEGFVDTFNYMVDFIENLVGEGDVDVGKKLTIDRSIPDSPVIRGGGVGSDKDDISIGENDSGKIEIKGFGSESDETVSVAQLMTTDSASSSGHSSIERYVPGGQADREIMYRKYGSLVCGTDSNIVFTNGTNGAVNVNVYYI